MKLWQKRVQAGKIKGMKFEYRGSGEDLEIRFENDAWVKLVHAHSLSPFHGVFLCDWVAKQWGRMPNASPDKAVNLPKIFSEPVCDNIVFYPGSFHPWHQGHQACVELTPARPLIVVPDANPWKEAHHFSNHCPWRELLLIAAQMPNHVHLYPGFWAKGIANPTVNWLPLTLWQKRGLTVGADSFLALPRWREPERLLASLEILYVVPREVEQDEILKICREIEVIAPDLKIEVLPHHQFETVSSSKIRNS